MSNSVVGSVSKALITSLTRFTILVADTRCPQQIFFKNNHNHIVKIVSDIYYNERFKAQLIMVVKVQND